MEGRQCGEISETREALPDGEGAALCQLPVPHSGQTVGTEDGDPEKKLPQATTAWTSYISYYTDGATASSSRLFWWGEDAPQFRLPNHKEGWDRDSTLMTPA